MNFYSTATLLLLLSATSILGGTTRKENNLCSLNCKMSENYENLFEVGQSYTYDYQASSLIATTSSNYDKTEFKIKSKIILTILSNCEMKMKMTNVQISDWNSKDGKYKEAPNSKHMKEILELYETYFNRANNEVESVCSFENEPIWAENIKKTIIEKLGINQQALQKRKTKNYMEYKTSVNPKYNDDFTEVTYFSRDHPNMAISTNLFQDLTEMSIFQTSDVDCAYVFHRNEKFAKIVECVQNYKTQPIQFVSSTFLTVELKSNLKFISKSVADDTSITNNVLLKSSILMKEEVFESSTITETLATLKSICEVNNNFQMPTLFMKLVNQLKRLTSKEIKEIYYDVVNYAICPGKSELRSIFYDAIGFVNSPDAVAVVIDLMKKNKMSVLDQSVWLTSLSFMQEAPTEEMLYGLESILDTKNINNQLYLTIGTITNAFCKDNYEKCHKNTIVQKIVKKLIKNLGTNCMSNEKTVSIVLISLKAIGNLKYYNNEIVTLLNNCASRKENTMSVRVSAIQVMKHMGCENDRSGLVKIMETPEIDAELRINAYLSVMGCQNVDTLIKVRSLLKKEKTNQVGSFIWTHLINIKSSEDKVKSHLKMLLSDVELTNEFDLSKLKFSRNIEKTFTHNVGQMNLDSNVIFSEKSFVPRSVSLNTTFNIMSHARQFVEFNGRFEGIEEMLFKILGPDGVLKKDKVNPEDNIALMKLLNEINGNIDFKLFGHQISFVELIRGSVGSVSKYNIIKEIMSLGDLKKIEVTKRLMLVDKSVNVITMIGLPIRIAIQGATSINVKIQSKFDITGLMKWPISLEINNHIAPQVAAEFQSDLALLTPNSKYGMKLVVKSSTDTEIKAKVLAKDNEEFSVQLDTPKSKQEIISVEGKSYVLYRDEMIPQMNDLTKINNTLCTSKKLIKKLGIEICANSYYVDSIVRKNALIFGPFKAAIFVNKKDTHTGYRFKILSKTVPHNDNGKVYNSRFYKFELDTPNSKLYRRRSFGELSMDYKKKELKLELEISSKHFLIKSNYQLIGLEKRVGLNMQINRKDVFNVMVEHVAISLRNSRIIRGGLVINMLDLQPIECKYKFQSKIDKFQMELSLMETGIFKIPLKMHMNIFEVKSPSPLMLHEKFKVIATYQGFFGKGKFQGSAVDNFYGHRWDIKVDHLSHKNPGTKYKMIFRHKTENKSSKTLMKYFFTTSISFGENAEKFVKLVAEKEMSNRHVRTLMKFNYGNDGTGSEKKFVEELKTQLYSGYGQKRNAPHIIIAEGKFDFKYPAKNINYQAKFTGEIERRATKFSLKLDNNRQPQFSVDINYDRPELYLKDTVFNVKIALPNHATQIKWNLYEVDVNKYQYTLETKYNAYDFVIEGTQLQLSSLNYDSEIKIKFPTVLCKLPQTAKLNLRIDLTDLKNSEINGKIEVPEHQYNYEIKTKFAFNPDNLMHLGVGKEKSVLRYQVELKNTQNSIDNNFVFICNPEEIQLFSGFSWNKEKNSDNIFEINFHKQHQTPNYKQVNSVAELSLRYLANYHAVIFKSEFLYTSLQAQLDLYWQKDRKISVNTMYEIDNSWTQKGLVSSLTIKTPFDGYKMTHFGINLVGELRYRKIDFQMKYGNNKKILFDIVVLPRSSSDFTISSKLITPFKGWSLVSIVGKHIYSKNSITTEGIMEIGANGRYNIKFEAINNSEYDKRDVMASLVIVSGILPTIKLSLLHKDDSIFRQTEMTAKWKKTEFLTIKSGISYSLHGYNLLTNGKIDLYSTIPQIKLIRKTWSIENRNGLLVFNYKLEKNSENLLSTSVKTYYENDDEMIKADIKLIGKLLQIPSIKVTSDFSLNHIERVITNGFIANQDENLIYSHNILISPKSVNGKIKLPQTSYKIITFSDVITVKDTNQYTRNSWIKIGGKFLINKKVYFEISNKPGRKVDFNGKVSMYSDYADINTIKSSWKMKYEPKRTKFTMDLFKSSEIGRLDLEILPVNEDFKEFKITANLKTMFESVKKMNLEFQQIPRKGRHAMKNSINFQLNDNIKFVNLVELRGWKFINIYSSLYRGSERQYFQIKHGRHMMGFTDHFETNLLRGPIKYICSYNVRGGAAFHAQLKTFSRYLKSFDLIMRTSQHDKQLDMVYAYNQEMLKLNYRNKKNLLNFGVNTKQLVNGEIKLNLDDWKKFLVKFDYQPLVEFNFNYEGGFNALKHSNELKLNYRDQVFEMKNKLEKVKWKYVLLESEMTNNFDDSLTYKFGLEYRLRPNNFEIDTKAFLNQQFIKIKSKFLMDSEKVILLEIATSLQALKQVEFETKFKWNNQLSQISESFKMALQSHDIKFLLLKKLEIAGPNYILLKAKAEVQTDKNKHLFEPKSFEILHQYRNQILKEKFSVTWNKNKYIQMNLDLPLKWKSISNFNIKCSETEEITLDVKLDLSQFFDKSLTLELTKNSKSLLDIKAELRKSGEIVKFSNNLSINNNQYNNEINVEFGSKIRNQIVSKLNVAFSKMNRQVNSIEFDVKAGKDMKSGNILLKFNTDNLFTSVWDCSKDNVNIKMTIGQLQGVVELKYNKVQQNLLTKITYDNKINELQISLDKNSLKFMTNINYKVELKFNFVLSQLKNGISIKGNSNIDGIQNFDGKIIATATPDLFKMSTMMNLETMNMFKLKINHEAGKTITVSFTSLLKYIQLVQFKLDYTNFPLDFSTKVNFEYLNDKKINMNINMNQNGLAGRLDTPYEMVKFVDLKGKLETSDGSIKCLFDINNNQLSQPIKGEFSYEKNKNDWKIRIFTSFLEYPKEINLNYNKDDKEQKLALVLDKEQMMSLVKKISDKNIIKLLASLELPESWGQFEWNSELMVDLESKVKSLVLTTDSNLFEKVTFKSNCDVENGEYSTELMMMKNINTKLRCKLVKKSLSEQKWELEASYNELKNTVLFEWQVKNVRNMNAKFDLIGSSKWEMRYNHELSEDLRKLSQKFDIKSNDKYVVTINNKWDFKSTDIQVESQTMLTINENEYENQLKLTSNINEFTVVIKSTNLLTSDIELLVSHKAGKYGMFLTTPFKQMNKFEVSRTCNSQINQICVNVIETDVIGKYEVVDSWQYGNNGDNEKEIKFIVKTPKDPQYLQTEIKMKDTTEKNWFYKLQVDFIQQTYQIGIVKKENIKRFNIQTPNEIIGNAMIEVSQGKGEFSMKCVHNKYETELVAERKSLDDIKLTFTSNLSSWKFVQLKMKGNYENFEMKFRKDDGSLELKSSIDNIKRTFTYQLNNDLIDIWLKSIDTKLILKSNKFLTQIKCNNQLIWQMSYVPFRVAFYSNLMNYKIKFYLDSGKLNLELKDSDTFFMEITRKSPNTIDGNLIVDKVQYSMEMEWKMFVENQIFWKVDILKERSDKLFSSFLDISSKMGRKLINMDMELKTTKLINVKLEIQPKKWSSEVRILTFNWVVDSVNDNSMEDGLINMKLSWNLMLAENQLSIGSLSTILKQREPINYSINLSLQSGSYEIQLMRLKDDVISLKLSTPFKGIDFDINAKHTFGDVTKCQCSLVNTYLGNVEMTGEIKFSTLNPYIKFVYVLNDKSLVSFSGKIYSYPEDTEFYGFITDLKLFDWENFELICKVSTKKWIEMEYSFRTPWRHLKMLSFKKVLKYESIMEHGLETTIQYVGVNEVKFVSGHEVSISKRIFKMDSKFYHNTVEAFTMTIDHKGNHEKLSHLVLITIRKNKYGYKLQGKLNPMFEGRTEIYTPYHKSGKLVLTVEQNSDKMSFEAEYGDKQQLGLINVERKNGFTMLKLVPPTRRFQPIELRYISKKNKRSIGGVMQTEVNYGGKQFLDFKSKVQMDKDKYVGRLSMKIPMFSEKEVEVSVNHARKDENIDFNHHLRLDNDYYKLLGKIFAKDRRNFNFHLKSNLGQYGKWVTSFGHVLHNDKHSSHLKVEQDEKKVINYKGDISIDRTKKVYQGKWTLETSEHEIESAVYHQNKDNKFSNEMKLKYNGKPVVFVQMIFGSSIYEKHQMRIELGDKLKMVGKLDMIYNRIDAQIEYQNNKYALETSMHNQQLRARFIYNDLIKAFIGIKLSGKSLDVELEFGETIMMSGKLVLENDSNDKQIIGFIKSSRPYKTKLDFKLSMNQFNVKINCKNNRIYSIKGYYTFNSTNKRQFDAKVTLDLNQLEHVVSVKINNELVDLKYNDYFVALNLGLPSKLEMKNNFLPIKNVELKSEIDWKNKSTIQLKLDKLVINLSVNFSVNQVTVTLENNEFYPKSVTIMGKYENTLNKKFLAAELILNKDFEMRSSFLRSQTLYSFGIETNRQHSFVLGYEKPKKKLILSLRNGLKYLNVINKIKVANYDGKELVVVNAKLESSLPQLYKVNNFFKYVIASNDYLVSNTLTINDLVLGGKIELTKSYGAVTISQNKLTYEIRVNRISESRYSVNVKSPSNTVDIVGDKDKNQTNVSVKWNKIDFVRILLENQEETSENKIVFHYYTRKVLDITIQRLNDTIRLNMMEPRKFELILINKLHSNGARTLQYRFRCSTYSGLIDDSIGITYKRDASEKILKLHLENRYHTIQMNCQKKKKINQHEVILVNKPNKLTWKVGYSKSKNGKIMMEFQTPELKTTKIEYLRKMENNQLQILYLNLFEILHMIMTPDGGSLSLYQIKLASIKMDRNKIELNFNENQPENNRGYMKISREEGGKWWAKDYSHRYLAYLKQESMNLNVFVSSAFVYNKNSYKREISFSYESISGEMKSFYLNTYFDWSISNELKIDIQSPIYSIKTVFTRSQPEKSKLLYKMVSYLKSDKQINGFLELATGKNEGITTRLYYNPNNEQDFAEFHMKYLNTRHFEIMGYLNSNKEVIKYGQLSIQLMNEKYVLMNFNVRSSMFKEFRRFTRQLGRSVEMNIEEYMKGKMEWLEDETTKRYQQIIGAVPNSNEVKMRLKIFFESFFKGMASLEREIMAMKRHNEFFIRTIRNAVLNLRDAVVRPIYRLHYFLRCRLEKYVVVFTRILHHCYSRAIDVYCFFSDIIQNLLGKLFVRLNRLCLSTFRTVFQLFTNQVNEILNSLHKMTQFINENFIVKTHKLRRAVRIFVMENLFSFLSNFAKNMKYYYRQPVMEFVKTMAEQEKVKEYYNKFVEKLDQMLEKMKTKLERMTSSIDNKFSCYFGIMKFMNVVNDLIVNIRQEIMGVLKSKHLHDLIAQQINRETSLIQNKIHSSLMFLMFDDIEISKNILTKTGYELEVKIPTIIPVYDLQSLPNFSYIGRKWQKVQSKFQSIKTMMYKQLNTVSKFKQMMDWFIPYFPQNPISFVPDFQTYATLISDSIVTFDKQSYSLLPTACKVVLAKESLFNQWQIVLDQSKPNKKYFEITINNQVIQVATDNNKVFLNNAPIELPRKIGTSTIVAFGRVLTLKDDKLGLTITIDNSNNILTVGITNWYHGKVEGLFGNADNEPHNDLLAAEMTGSQIVNGRKSKHATTNGCKLRLQFVKTVSNGADKATVKDCPFLRKVACKFMYRCPFSPMGACFKKVDPTKFYQMCIGSSSEMLIKMDKAVCNSARNYQTQCLKTGVKVQLPRPCRKCETNGKTLLVDEYEQVKITNEKAADFVFILDENNQCINSISSGLISLFHSVERTVRKRGVNSIRFGLIGFRGNEVDGASHSHTISQKLMGNRADAIKVLRTMKSNSSSKSKSSGESEAIELAAIQYPWKQHASRHIIMISCSKSLDNWFRISHLNNILQSRSIKFSYISSLELTSASPDKTTIFGMDKDKIFGKTIKNNRLESETKMNAGSTQYYKIAQLAIEGNGLAYNVNYLKNQSVEKSNFVKSFANELSSRTSPARSSKCTCIDDSELVCRPIEVHAIFPAKNSKQ